MAFTINIGGDTLMIASGTLAIGNNTLQSTVAP
jgi:hypothetical protein